MNTTLEIPLNEMVKDLLSNHKNALTDIAREEVIKQIIIRREAIPAATGVLATWTAPESTGRSPKDTYIVKRPESQSNIDWESPNNIPLSPKAFELLFHDALARLEKKDMLFVTNRVIGADSNYALPVQTVTDHALTALFTDNMFRPRPKDLQKSCFANTPFTLLTLPEDKLKANKYDNLLRKMPNGETSNMAVVMDMDKRIGIIIGSAYLGSVKKLMFTVMNYYLPFQGILPLHCSANEGENGDSALLLGLSGTGKTTLSADPERALLGDDEHGWGTNGIANFENGCYAKMIDITAESEPEIYEAVMHKESPDRHGAIIENAMMYPNGHFDFSDDRLTPNSRSSYPLTFLHNIKASSTSGHPTTILFLTADAYGVLPPISRLNKEQAMLWFLMGYTSKLAGTETGVKEPEATFSRFFGQPFMPVNPDVYAEMLGQKMEEHNVRVFLINTGWSGGPYGIGSRIKLRYTRAMVNAALRGTLDQGVFVEDDLFHLSIPKECPGVPEEILIPKNTWKDKREYTRTAHKLASFFSEAFDFSYSKKHISPEIVAMCPGK